ncbi:heme/copper-type cytochrome/quinol oxidase subunit 2 [Parvibaculum indicum]|uniref:PLD nuclease N-terminal domain-containing protein n=1 Tax=Parvibaculum indicum TaxID=562969 RepID=UPI00142267F3|nr:PLD nuclease N-terminal domain-containing protein [Parvibaculum indicum]NIJ42114.1 heme/copper-type cytochrome/quinol oxidase subunit 2 [Parvibaculum indicum]
MGMEYSGILGIIILVLDIYAIVKIAQSSAEPLWKAIWIVLVIVLPVIGLIIWFLFGPKG